jgi:hypothetical protein
MGYFVGVLCSVGVAGIYLGTATDECIRGLIVMYYWYKKKWFGKSVVDKRKKIVIEPEDEPENAPYLPDEKSISSVPKS